MDLPRGIKKGRNRPAQPHLHFSAPIGSPAQRRTGTNFTYRSLPVDPDVAKEFEREGREYARRYGADVSLYQKGEGPIDRPPPNEPMDSALGSELGKSSLSSSYSGQSGDFIDEERGVASVQNEGLSMNVASDFTSSNASVSPKRRKSARSHFITPLDDYSRESSPPNLEGSDDDSHNESLPLLLQRTKSEIPRSRRYFSSTVEQGKKNTLKALKAKLKPRWIGRFAFKVVRFIRSTFWCWSFAFFLLFLTVLIVFVRPLMLDRYCHPYADCPSIKRGYFSVVFVDGDNGLPLSGVEMTTLSNVKVRSDSNGAVLFSEPGLMGTQVFFWVYKGGYATSNKGLVFSTNHSTSMCHPLKKGRSFPLPPALLGTLGTPFSSHRNRGWLIADADAIVVDSAEVLSKIHVNRSLSNAIFSRFSSSKNDGDNVAKLPSFTHSRYSILSSVSTLFSNLLSIFSQFFASATFSTSPSSKIRSLAAAVGQKPVKCSPSFGSYFGIHVIDSYTDRGVPFIFLRAFKDGTDIGWSGVTDSSGHVSFYKSGCMSQEIGFAFSSPGYESHSPVTYDTQEGIIGLFRIHRYSIAERIVRTTGSGEFIHSTLLGLDIPIDSDEANMNGGIVSAVTSQCLFHDQRVHCFWRDTITHNAVDIHNHTIGGVVSSHGYPSLDDVLTKQFTYYFFVEMNGYVKDLFRGPRIRASSAYVDSLYSFLIGSSHTERILLGMYAIHDPIDPLAVSRGFVKFDDERLEFRFGTPAFPNSALFDVRDETKLRSPQFAMYDPSSDYIYFGRPFPVIRVTASYALFDEEKYYEFFTCLEQDERVSNPKPKLDKSGAEGTLVYSWKFNTTAVDMPTQMDLSSEGFINLEFDAPLFQIRDVITGIPISILSGQMINDGASKPAQTTYHVIGANIAGFVYYSTSNNVLGPWLFANRVVESGDYLLTDVSIFPTKSQDELGDCSSIIFSATLNTVNVTSDVHDDNNSNNDDETKGEHDFVGNEHAAYAVSLAVPRWDQNTVLYKLNTTDSRLLFPMFVSSTISIISSYRLFEGNVTLGLSDGFAFLALPLSSVDLAQQFYPVVLYSCKQKYVSYSTLTLDSHVDNGTCDPIAAVFDDNQFPALSPLYRYEYQSKSDNLNDLGDLPPVLYGVSDALPMTIGEYQRKPFSPICWVWEPPLGGIVIPPSK